MGKETILVTSALPYANGPIHFGHIAGAYLPADVFVRFNKLLKNDIVYICGTDEYGVAIEINAEKEKVSPRDHVDHYHQVIVKIFEQFNIQFDHFSRTTTERHAELSQQFFSELHQNGHIDDKTEDQLYCKACDKFLADRYIEGICHECHKEGARGDECPHCGAWLEPLKIKEPQCKICGQAPEVRSTRHWYLKLSDFKQRLHEWLDQHNEWKSNVLQVARQQIDELESRPITRDMKWGIPVPLPEADGKVLYVWFDAPIGYVDATMEWAEKIHEPEKWRHYWQNPDCKIVNFIGKDNIPFHLLVWPSVLMGQTTPYTLAHNVPANEFYNLEGRQFSKSEGWTVDLDNFFDSYTSDQIRYAIAANAPENKDSDFNWRDFQKFNNADLANVLGNLINRLMTFTRKNFDGAVPPLGKATDTQEALLEMTSKRKKEIAGYYQSFQLRKAAYAVIDLARLGNRYFDEEKPWIRIKEDKESCGQDIHVLFRLVEQLATVAWPILPETATSIRSQLNLSGPVLDQGWESPTQLPVEGGHSLGQPVILFKKIEDKEIEQQTDKLKTALASKDIVSEEQSDYAPLAPEINFEDFCKLDLRVARILEATPVPKSDKLLKLKVDLGFEQRQILAGIAKAFQPESLIGKKVTVVANLKPRKMMGELSQGMVLAAGSDQSLTLLDCSGSTEGLRVQ